MALRSLMALSGSARRLSLLALAVGMASGGAQAQEFILRDLSSGSFNASIAASDGDGTQAVGRGRRTNEGPRPVLWNPLTAVPTPLPLAGWWGAEDIAFSGNRMAASFKATQSSDSRACYWPDLTDDPASIHPSGYSWSRVNGLDANEIVGVAYPSSGWYHAFRWSALTGVGTSLHAARLGTQAIGGTIARATDGVRQVGWADLDVAGFPRRAVQWTGTPDSIVNLHPTGWLNSYAWGVFESSIVGSVWNSNASLERAVLWASGLPILLHPASGWTTSKATEVGDGWQAGWGTRSNGSIGPLLWRGTAESALDLAAAVGQPNATGQVLGADPNGNLYGTLNGRAVVWLRTRTTVTGTVTLGDFSGDPRTVPVTLTFRTPGTLTARETHVVALSTTGAFSVTSNLPAGSYDVAFFAPRWLRHTQTNAGLSAPLAATLINGDVDGDNTVTVFDYDALSAAFDTSVGHASWNPLADLDGDGTVTVFDYDVLSANFDRTGDL